MLDFFKNYWQVVLDAILVIISIILFVKKKKPIEVIDTLKQLMTTWLPGVITSAEKSGLKGQDKLNYCINALYEVFVKDYLSYSDFLKRYRDYLVNQIEAILSTPQKKGDF